jgi:hypothetical protein
LLEEVKEAQMMVMYGGGVKGEGKKEKLLGGVEEEFLVEQVGTGAKGRRSFGRVWEGLSFKVASVGRGRV